MSKLQILTTLLLSYLLFAFAEEKQAQKRIDDILKPPPIIIIPSKVPQEENTYFSKFTNWIKSFGEPEKKTTILHTSLPPGPPIISGPSAPPFSPNGPSFPPSASPNFPSKNYGPPQTFAPPFSQRPSSSSVVVKIPSPSYSPSGPQPQSTLNSNKYLPPHPSGDKERDCHPCNKEPWIPVAGKYGSNTLIGFVPNSDLSNNDRPSGLYGPPQSSFHPSSNQYGPPKHVSPPNGHYGLPQDISVHKSPSNNYGLPNNGPPAKYGPPKPIFLPTPNPIIPNKYGPPSKPRPNRPKQILPPRPNTFVGPPPAFTKYGPPAVDFGKIHSINHGSQSSGGQGFLPLPPINNYGPPPSGPTNISPLKLVHPPINYEQSKVPVNSYSPPPSGPAFNPPANLPGKYGPPSGVNNQYFSPNFPTPTATAVDNNYDFPPTSLDSLPKLNHPTSFVTPVPLLNNKPIQNSYEPPAAGPIQNSGKFKVTSDEYLPPSQQLPLSNGHENNYDNTPLISQPDSSFHKGVVEPIPFPNMSPTFILPIRNAHPFKSNPISNNLSSQRGNIPVHSVNNANHGSHVQITQSVPVADFLSTIEYPPNVVQSPLIDLVVNDNIETVAGQHNNNNNDNNNGYQENLNDNPIIVDNEEHHQEASDNHASVAIHDTISTKLTFSPNLLNSFEDSKPTASGPISQEYKNSSTNNNIPLESSLQTILNDNSLASIIAKQLISENNNPPKPFESSAKNIQKEITQVNQNAQATNNALFVQPTIDYSNWNPSAGSLSTGIKPPSPSQSSWISTNNYISYTTKKPKQIQIIVPYTTNNKGNNWHQKNSGPANSPYNPPISLFSKLPSAEESQWEKYIDHNFQESKTNIAQTASPISNIQDFFKDVSVNIDASHQNLPFDILKLQKNIDVWTEQEFNKMRSNSQSSTTSRFAYSKQIPEEYLTTQSINEDEVTTISPRNSKIFHDYLASGSVHRSVESRPQNLSELVNIDNNLLDSNFIATDLTTTQIPDVTPTTWEKIQVSISPLTNERVYVVTPLPWENDAPTPQSAWSYVPKNEIQQINKKLADNAKFAFNSPRFSIRPEPVQMNKSKDDINNKIHFVYSDWPDLINNLATTTVSPLTTSYSVTTPHPLLGRMDISEHTQAPSRSDRTLQTHTGHSKVVTTVTASTLTKKRTEEDKKFTSTTKKPVSNKT